MQTINPVLRELGVTFIRSHKGISEYRLNVNSLKIILAPIPTSRVVAIVQHINVGSRHEGAGNTGYSHLLEHMLFKGTPTHNAELGNSYDQFVKKLGNVCNATTWYDRTNYFAKIPAAYLGEYLEYEADRLRNAIITDDDLATEMPVVVDEFDIGENDPESVLDRLVTATMFTEHPYKVDTIGAKSEVLQVTAASLREKLYDVYYWPNNTTLVIVGGFDEEEALRQVAAKYSHIPASPNQIPTSYTVEPPQFGQRRVEIEKPGELPIVEIGFHIPESRHPDSYALAALGQMLGGGTFSRLYRRLVDKGLASDVSASAQHLHDPGFLKITVKLTEESSPEQIERIVRKEIERLCTRLVTKEEMAVCKDENRSGTVISQADPLRWAQAISDEEAIADWYWGADFDDQFDKVTREDIMAVAKRYLKRSNGTIGYFLPTDNAAETAAGPAAVVIAEERQCAAPMTSTARAAQPTDSQPASSLCLADSVRKQVLPNGLTLLLLPTERETAVGVSFFTQAGTYCAPADRSIVARLVANMLPEGSARYSKDKIAKLSSRFGIQLRFNESTFQTSMKNLVPPAHLAKYIDLLADVIQHPEFNDNELNVLKTTLAAEISEDGNDPEWRAMTEMARVSYVPGSPHHRQTAEELQAQLVAVTAKDLKAYHAAHFSPRGSYLALVGKFDAAKMLKLIESKFGPWTAGNPLSLPAATTVAKAPSRINVQIDGKDNLTIIAGVPADLSVTSPDSLAAQLANRCLGGDTLTSRLGLEIREKRGLTYGVVCFFTDLVRPGAAWTVSMTTNGAKLEQAVPLIGEVVHDFVENGITAEELQSEKDSMVNSFAMQLDSPSGIADAIALYAFTGRELSQIDDFEQRVRALTTNDVNAAARKHFRVDEMATIVAGNLPRPVKGS